MMCVFAFYCGKGTTLANEFCTSVMKIYISKEVVSCRFLMLPIGPSG